MSSSSPLGYTTYTSAAESSEKGASFASLPGGLDSDGSSGGSVTEGEACPTVLRCGVSAQQGRRSKMEDASLAVDSINGLWMGEEVVELPDVAAFYAVFDGHNGPHAAEFAREHLLTTVVTSETFPRDIEASLASAFLAVDQQYLAAISHKEDSAGTTALAALVWGGHIYLANAGDCRAVMSRRGKALDLTKDHKPRDPEERRRIELSGGFVCQEGLLCGELAVARALGDHHLTDLKGAEGPLIAQPELTHHCLTPQDEFLLIGSDGLWDVFPSQRAVEFARQRLLAHNDPQRCSEELVAEALERHTSDNVTAITVCFGEEGPQRRVYRNSRLVSL